MAFLHAPLTEAQLGPMVAKMVGAAAPAPMRKMVAGGLAPLPPRDLVLGLYQLWVLNEDPFAEMAARTAEGLPRPVIDGALADTNIHAGVLDFLARKLVRQAEPLDKLVRHPQVSDETIIGIARVCPELVTDTLAENQDRWLRCPKIVDSLYRNPNTKMSVVHRMLELAEREHLDLRLPGMEEIRMVLRGAEIDPGRDALFRRTVAGGHETLDRQQTQLSASRSDEDVDTLLAPDHEQAAEEANEAASEALDEASEASDEEQSPSVDEVGDDSRPDEMDAEPATVNDGNDAESDPAAVDGATVDDAAAVGAGGEPALGVAASRENRLSQLLQMRPLEKIRVALLGDQFDRSILVRDSNKMVAMATIKSPKIRDDEVVGYSANRSLSHDVIRYIANRRDWVRLYQVKFNLVMNPKTPMSRAMALLSHLHANDVRKVARSRNISSALAKAAKRRGDARR